MVELPVIEQVISNDLRVPDGLRVEGVYIRSVPSYSVQIDSRFDGTWYEFDHWAQMAWSLMKKGIITASVLPQLLRSFHNHHGVPLAHLRWCIYRALEKEIHATELRNFAEQSLLELANLGASGPTRRMLGWEFDFESAKTLDGIDLVDPREDANQWYRSIVAARLDRKKQQR
jgi:hypothetical protein